MANLPERRGDRSLLSKADDVLLVVVVAALVLAGLQVVGWVLSTIALLVKVAVVGAVVAIGLAWVARR